MDNDVQMPPASHKHTQRQDYCVCAVVGSSRVYLAPVLSVFLSVLVGVSSRVLYCLDANDVVLSYFHTTWRLLVRLLKILMVFVNI